MFELIFLGTSASAPSIHRGLPAQIVLADQYRFLIDCGEGTQRQILKSGVGFRRLNRILLTHSHLDHILGLAGLLSTFANWENIERLEIWGGTQTLNRVDRLVDVTFGPHRPRWLRDWLHLVDIKPGLIFETKKFSLRAFHVTHRGPDNLGYLLEERTHRPFLIEQAEALGVPVGPERGRLTKGESVTLADGRVIHPDDVLGQVVPGAKLALIGDIARTDNLPDSLHDTDALVMEATYLEEEADLANEVGHMTAGKAAQYALESNVKTLILTHLSRRNRERDIVTEARKIFPRTFVARDFDRFAVIRDKPVTKLSHHHDRK